MSFKNEIHGLMLSDIDTRLILTYCAMTPAMRNELLNGCYEDALRVLKDLCSAWLFHLNMRLMKESLQSMDPRQLTQFHQQIKTDDDFDAFLLAKVKKFSLAMPSEFNLQAIETELSFEVKSALQSASERATSFHEISERFRNDQKMAHNRIFVGSLNSENFLSAYEKYKKMYERFSYQLSLAKAINEDIDTDIFSKTLLVCPNPIDLLMPVDGGSSIISAIAGSNAKLVDIFAKHLFSLNLEGEISLLDKNLWSSKLSKMNSIWFESAGSGLINAMQLLLSLGISVETLNNTGKTALCVAASRGKTDVINFLTTKGANVNRAENSNFSPLHEALSAENPIPILTRFLALGADVDQKNINGLT
ncbi:MAG: ankyrin repeat domain-containing protein, partial [Gammaproteobacteria bacterium]